MRGLRPLWIAYDGVLAGPGRSQVVPHLLALATRGLRPALLTWEKPGPLGSPAHRELRATLRRAGIRWRALPYHRRPTVPATAADLLHGLVAGAGLRPFDLVHGRSILSTLVGRGLARVAGVPWIFDTRGFWAEERVDGGIWPRDGALHRGARRIEERATLRADGLVVLTHRAERILRERGATAPMRVIPTCVDVERFSPVAPVPSAAADLRDRRTYLLLGATGTWYRRDAMLDYLADALAADADARAAILSEEHHDQLREGLARRGIVERTILTAVPHEEVPGWIAAASVVVMFIRPAPSKAASCPTKLGEILAVGRPVVVNAGVGDMDALVGDAGVGVVLRDPGPGAFARSRERLARLLADPDLATRCRNVALESLSLERGVDAYLDLYREVLAQSGPGRALEIA